MATPVGFWKAVGVTGGGVGLVAVVLGVRAFAAPAGGAVPSYTGCLQKGGSIVDVAPGDQPAAPCKGGAAAVVRLSGGDITAVHTPAGGGLRGGGASGDVSLSLAPIPAARVNASAPIAIAHDTLTMLPLDRVEFDTAGLHDPMQNDRLIAPIAGIYAVSGHVSWPLNAQGRRDLYLTANIGIVFQRVASSTLPGSGAGQTEQSISTVVRLDAGDFVQLEVRQSSGGTEIVQVSDHGPTLTMAWLGPSS
jgi:hypothetical protein